MSNVAQSRAVTDDTATVEVLKKNQKAPTLDDVLDAIKQVESGGDPNVKPGDAGKSLGMYQIGWAYCKDATLQLLHEHNNRIAIPDYDTIVKSEHWSREIIKAYWRRYCPGAYQYVNWRALVRAHNGGGVSGPIEAATIPYADKIRKVLQARGFKV